MSDKNFKVKNGIDAVGPITISPSSNSITGLVINSVSGGTGIIFNRNGSQVGSIDEWGTYNGSGISIVQPWYTRSPGIESQSFFWVGSGSRSAAGFAGTNSGTNPVIYISQTGTATNDLTQWIKPDNTVLAKIDYLGNITANDLTLSGNLTVNGTTTNLNSTNLVIEDKNIIIADVATPTDTTADGAGITIKGATDKTLNWVQSTGSFTSSEPFIINTNSTTKQNLIIKAIASQTSSLTEWHNSLGGVVAKIDSNAIFNSLNASSGTDSYSSIIIGGRWIRNEQRSGLTRFGVNTGEWHLASNPDNSVIAITDSQVGVFATSTTLPLFTVKGMISQSANLQEWQDSAGTVLAKVDASGNITLPNGIFTSNGVLNATGLYSAYAVGIGLARATGNANLAVTTGSTTNVGILVKAVASQSANLQEWQNSAGTVLAKVKPDGGIYVEGGGAQSSIDGANGQLSIRVGGELAASATIGSGYAAGVALIAKGVASQTGDLQQWRNSAGTVLASISSTGKLTSAADALINGITLGWGGGQDYHNLAFGYNALQNNTTGTINMGFGYRALQSNTTGWNNLAMGSDALVANTTGTNNTAVGAQALYSNTSGGENVAIGNWALLNGNGGWNTAVGASSMNQNSGSGFNTAVGRASLYSISTGSHNTAIGQQAAGGTTTGNSNSILGSEALISLTTGNNNIAIGRDAGRSVITGSGNIFLGYQAGYSETGSNKLYISNSNTVTPLIGGDFSAKTLTVAGNATITSQATGTIGLIVKGAASQTADLQQWQDSGGSVLANVDKNGYFRGPLVEVKPTNPGLYGIAIAANASQSGDLFQITDTSNNAYTGVSATGKLVTGNTTNASRFTQITDSALGQLTVYSPTASTKGIVVKGATSQTANLQEWQNSDGTVLAKVNASGVLTAPAINIVGQSVSSNTTIISGYRYFVDTTAARTLTLPASPSVGDEIQIFDANNSASTYNITVDSNSAKIEGVVEQYLIDVNGAAVTMTYTGSTFGWKVRS